MGPLSYLARCPGADQGDEMRARSPRQRSCAASMTERVLAKDEMLDDITLYWLTNTAASSARLYWEDSAHKIKVGGVVSIPAAVSRFPREIIPVPRSWAERAYPNLVYFNELEKGGHFAAWEQPELFAAEMRAAFRSLR